MGLFRQYGFFARGGGFFAEFSLFFRGFSAFGMFAKWRIFMVHIAGLGAGLVGTDRLRVGKNSRGARR
jgi:hypothetical protein